MGGLAFLIIFPFSGIVYDVLGNFVIFCFVTDDAFPIISLPY